MMEPDNFKVIVKRLDLQDKKSDQIEQGVSRMDRDMTEDRKNFDKMIILLTEVSESNKAILSTLARFQVKTHDAVADAVTEAVGPVQESMDTFIDKKVIPLTPEKVEKLTLWSKFSKLITKWRSS